MSDLKAPSRSDLAKFLPTQELIRAFEQLFNEAGRESPDLEAVLQQIEQLSVTSAISDSSANEAIAGVSRLFEEIRQSLLFGKDDLSGVIASAIERRIALIPPQNEIVTRTHFLSLANDVSNSANDTLADVTGLSFPVVNGGRYWFRFFITYDAAATTTGSRWSINGPTASRLAYRSSYALTTTTNTENNLVGYNQPAASNASSADTAGNVAIIEGTIEPSADGVVIARFASGVLSSAITAKAGSFVQYMRA